MTDDLLGLDEADNFAAEKHAMDKMVQQRLVNATYTMGAERAQQFELEL